MNTQKESKPKTGIVILILLVFALLLLNMFQWYRTEHVSGRKSPIKLENEKLVRTINSAKLEINKFKGISAKLDQVVKEANGKIKKQEEKIFQLQASGNILEKENTALRNEIDEIKEEYLGVIDSFLIADMENLALEISIDMLEDEIKELNDKMGKAELLIADNIKATPLKEKQHGYSSETALAKKVKVVKVCFDIQDNKVAHKGIHEIYLRIIAPDGRILYSEEDNLKKILHPLLMEKVNYSFNESIKFNNQKMNQCLRWHVSESLVPGVYVAEVLTQDNFLGTTTFSVK